MTAIIPTSWQKQLSEVIDSDFYTQLMRFVSNEYEQKKIHPPEEQMFEAFKLCKFSDVKVVLIGQDPYHGVGQANGLSFSVNDGIKKPPSLINIFKALNNDLNKPIPESGNLDKWAKQGVLLLNATLTVVEGKPGSHQKKGWETFTNEVIKIISERKEHIVFLLWGAHAHKKEALIDEKKHCILKSVHPSPLSAYRGFLENKHFSKTNLYLTEKGKQPIEW